MGNLEPGSSAGVLVSNIEGAAAVQLPANDEEIGHHEYMVDRDAP